MPTPNGERGIPAFSNTAEIKGFLGRESAFWRNKVSIPEIGNPYAEMLSTITTAQEVPSRAQALQLLTPVQQRFQNSPYWITSTSALGQFLVDLRRRNSEALNGALSYLRGELQLTQLQRERFYGMVSVSLFLNDDPVTTSANAHLGAIASARDEIEGYRRKLAEDYGRIKDEVASWQTNAQAQAAAIFSKAEMRLDETIEVFNERIDVSSTAFKTFADDSTKKVTDLETTYGEKLKLAAPAQYWEEIEKRYKTSGRVWMGIASAMVLAVFAAVAYIVYLPPLWMQDENIKLEGVRGMVILAVGFSLFIYLINLLFKLTTSAFHLVRDAAERRQLTLVFLALIKDGAVTDEDRTVILQSLFARADTGLLKGEGAPTTPLGAILDLAKHKSGD